MLAVPRAACPSPRKAGGGKRTRRAKFQPPEALGMKEGREAPGGFAPPPERGGGGGGRGGRGGGLRATMNSPSPAPPSAGRPLPASGERWKRNYAAFFC